MSYTPYYNGGWKDWPDVSTPVNSAALTHIESGITSASQASSVANAAELDLQSDSGVVGSGDIVFKTGTTEQLRVQNSGGLKVGAGDVESVIPNYNATQAKQLDLRLGTAATPDGGLFPPVKVSRIFTQAAANVYSDGAENLAGISSNVVGAVGTQTQAVGVYAAAANSSTSVGAGGAKPDACALYGIGYITGSGVGTGAGGFFLGRKDATAGLITSAQVLTWNASGVDTSYSSSVASDCGIWLQAGGGKNSGAGILLSANDTTSKFDVGIGFTSASGVNPIKSASIRDDSSAATSIIINGTHTGYGIDLNGGTFTSGVIRLPNNQAVYARNAAGNADVMLFKLDGSNLLEIGSNPYFIGSPIFSNSVQFNDSALIQLGTSTGTQIGTATNQKLSFYGATPIVQPSAVGTATGYTAGTTAGTFHTDDKYTGNVGTTAYTINGIVAALKNLGLIAS